MLSNEELMIVLRRQINSDVDQRATAINGTTGRDRLFGHLWARRFQILCRREKIRLPILGLPARKLVTSMSDLSLLQSTKLKAEKQRWTLAWSGGWGWRLAVSYKMIVHDATFSLYFENPRSLEVLKRFNVRPSFLKARMAFYKAANYTVVIYVQKGATYTDIKCLLAP